MALLDRIAQERLDIGSIDKISGLAQIEATLAVARTNLLVAQAIAEQNELAGGVIRANFSVDEDFEDDSEE